MRSGPVLKSVAPLANVTWPRLRSQTAPTEVTEGLVPALQRRGLTRTAYTGTTLRDVLREF